MSIPPLVCSTPPPPDQCEDDKDHDDYELPYNLSQDDDENNDYDFGNYPTYSHFQTQQLDKQEDIPTNTVKLEESSNAKNASDTISVNSENEHFKSDTELGTKDTNEIKLENDEEFDLEDLNLKLDSASPSSSVKDSCSGDEISKHENSVSSDSVHIPKNTNTESQEEDSSLPTCAVEPESIDCNESLSNRLDDYEKVNFPVQSEDSISNDNPIDNIVIDKVPKNEKVDNDLNDQPHITEEVTINDEFGDFDEFQFIAPEGKSSTFVEECENPWQNKETNDSEFGNFTANFDNDDVKLHKSLPSGASDDNHSEVGCPDLHNDDDEFGDFDDYQSSTATNETKIISKELESSNTVPVLNFQSTESEAQIMDSINKVLSAIFLEEISEPVNEVEVKLESFLSETWGHLMETDVRQPYIVNWNSSLGQKTLLKALCIDSRNILFGPKWSHNMPKYAANLSNAPLQPQKQLSNTPQAEVTSSEKPTSRANNWSDPFTSNGQEFTYAEALLLDLEHLMATLDQIAHNHSTLKISELLSHACNAETEANVAESRPTDLDVFESAMSAKSEKIYSSTLNVQPIRQINLPDTHIFTPTDSETPRSKTIHYDSNPTSLLPQATENHNNQIQITPLSTLSNEKNIEEDDDYWEFQEFKTMPVVNRLPDFKNQLEPPAGKTGEVIAMSNPLPKPSMAYQTQLLQPIKLEPAMPTLNWPDPGEIKEEFDDFSDFVSTSSWVDKNLPNPSTEAMKSTDINETAPEITMKPEKEVENEVINSSADKNMDDDFDTFQSALPSVNKSAGFKIDNVTADNSLPHNINQFDFEKAISTEGSVKTDTISFESTFKTNESLPQPLGIMMNTPETTTRNSPSMGTQLPMNLLQPIPASSATALPSNQQKNGQILQPLSLESYSQINWPSPGIDLQDLSRFNPVETLHSLKSDLSVSGQSKNSPIHNSKPVVNNQVPEDDVWGEFVSSKPSPKLSQTKKQMSFGDDDEWTDFVSSPSVKPHNGLNTISLNVHTNSNIQKTTSQSKFTIKSNQISLDIPTLNYITPKTNNHKSYNDRHFQNL